MGNQKIIVTTPKGSVVQFKTEAGEVAARIEWNPGFGANKTAVFQKGQAMMDSEVMRLMEPYMQLLTGAMIMSMRLSTTPGSGEVIVNTPYASRVYYTKSGIGRKTGPLRGPRYFDRMKADKKDQLRRTAAAAMGGK